MKTLLTRRSLLTSLATALFLFPAIAMADGPAAGEIWVTLKGSDYCKPYEGGDEYSNHDFEDNGFKLVIRLDDYTTERTFEVRSVDESLAPVTVVTDAKKFKKTRVKGEKLPRLVMKVDAKFVPKPKDAPPPPAEPGAEPK